MYMYICSEGKVNRIYYIIKSAHLMFSEEASEKNFQLVMDVVNEENSAI